METITKPSARLRVASFMSSDVGAIQNAFPTSSSKVLLHSLRPLYFYFCALKDLWSCRIGGSMTSLKMGYATTGCNGYE
jgi:hypothetical protein